MTHSTIHGRRAPGRRGFTLVELLVTVAIMGILSAMVVGALAVTRASARAAATKATIAKLHNILIDKYESYRTRRVPIDTTGMQPLDAARARLRALRDLMRMEMPERVTDVFNVDNNGNPGTVRGPVAAGLTGNPSLLQTYASRVASQSAGWSQSTYRGEQQAECLYMIVATAGADAIRQFRTAEIGDTNGNGLPEFLDGWGHPIRFLRWAPGFNDSDLQSNVITDADLASTSVGNESNVWTSNSVKTARQTAADVDHDPFDPRRVSMGKPSDNPFIPRGWRLVPLIYSAGPDGEYGIGAFPSGAGSDVWWSNSGSSDDHYAFGFGIPNRTSSSPSWRHFDNIHNHRIEMEAE